MVLNYNDYFHLLSTYSCQALAEHFKYIISNYHNTSDRSYNFSYFIYEKIETERG